MSSTDSLSLDDTQPRTILLTLRSADGTATQRLYITGYFETASITANNQETFYHTRQNTRHFRVVATPDASESGESAENEEEEEPIPSEPASRNTSAAIEEESPAVEEYYVQQEVHPRDTSKDSEVKGQPREESDRELGEEEYYVDNRTRRHQLHRGSESMPQAIQGIPREVEQEGQNDDRLGNSEAL